MRGVGLICLASYCAARPFFFRVLAWVVGMHGAGHGFGRRILVDLGLNRGVVDLVVHTHTYLARPLFTSLWPLLVFLTFETDSILRIINLSVFYRSTISDEHADRIDDSIDRPQTLPPPWSSTPQTCLPPPHHHTRATPHQNPPPPQAHPSPSEPNKNNENHPQHSPSSPSSPSNSASKSTPKPSSCTHASSPSPQHPHPPSTAPPRTPPSSL